MQPSATAPNLIANTLSDTFANFHHAAVSADVSAEGPEPLRMRSNGKEAGPLQERIT